MNKRDRIKLLARRFIDSTIIVMEVGGKWLRSEKILRERYDSHEALISVLGIDKHKSREITDNLDFLGLSCDFREAKKLSSKQRDKIVDRMLKALKTVEKEESF